MAKNIDVEPAAYGAAAEALAAGRPSHIIVYKESVDNVTTEFQKVVKSAGTKHFALAENVVAFGSKGEGEATAKAFSQLKIVAGSLTADEHQKLLASGAVEAVFPNRQRFVMSVPGSIRTGVGDEAESRRPTPAQPPAQPGSRGGGAQPSRGLGNTGGPVFPFGSTAGPTFPFGSIPEPTFPPFGGGTGPTFPSGWNPGPTFPFGSTGGPVFPFGGGRDLLTYLTGHRDAIDALLSRLAGLAAGSAAAAMTPAVRAATGLTWGLTAVGVSAATGQLTGRDVKVAILDTGLDLTHPDWANHPVAKDKTGTRARSFVPGVDSIMDGHGHGTHTAGTLAGPLNSVSGTRYGVAPECDLFVGKVLDDSGSGFDSDILAGIQWAMTNKCRVISMSLGSVREPREEFSPKYETAAQRVLDLGDGTLIVAAAGNESARSRGLISPVGNPAACPSIPAVAAVDADLRVADFSCGQVDSIGVVDLAAPGVGVFSSFPVSKGRFAELDGTSMATPHVAGVAACLLQANPSLTARELWDRLLATARPLASPATDVGRGLVSLLAR